MSTTSRSLPLSLCCALACCYRVPLQVTALNDTYSLYRHLHDIFLIVNKSHDKPQTNNMLICLHRRLSNGASGANASSLFNYGTQSSGFATPLFVFLKINLSSYSPHNQVIIFKQPISVIILLFSATDKNK